MISSWSRGQVLWAGRALPRREGEQVLPLIEQGMRARHKFNVRSVEQAVPYPPSHPVVQISGSEPLGRKCPVRLATAAEEVEGKVAMALDPSTYWTNEPEAFAQQPQHLLD